MVAGPNDFFRGESRNADHSVTNIRIFEYIRIFSATNIRSYHIRILFLIRIYSYIRSYHFFDPNIFGYSFVSYFSYHRVLNIRIFEYIRIFSATNIRSYHIRILFLIRIYSDIRSYCFFQYEYIRIFVRIKISYSSHCGSAVHNPKNWQNCAQS